MKKILLLVSSLLFVSCNNGGSNSGNTNPRVDEQAKTEENIRVLTSTRWCAQEDSDGDGHIGTYLFNANGNVEWVGYNLNTGKAYSRDTMRWAIQGDFLQIGLEMNTLQGTKVTFRGFGSERVMSWFQHTLPSPQNPGADKISPAGPPNYVAIPCSLDI